MMTQDPLRWCLCFSLRCIKDCQSRTIMLNPMKVGHSFNALISNFTLRAAPSKDAIIWILDDLTTLHESSSSFRRVFRSQSTAQLLVDGLNIFSPVRQPPRVLDAKISVKLTHFGLLVAMGKHISTSQKQQVFHPFVI